MHSTLHQARILGAEYRGLRDNIRRIRKFWRRKAGNQTTANPIASVGKTRAAPYVEPLPVRPDTTTGYPPTVQPLSPPYNAQDSPIGQLPIDRNEFVTLLESACDSVSSVITLPSVSFVFYKQSDDRMAIIVTTNSGQQTEDYTKDTVQQAAEEFEFKDESAENVICVLPNTSFEKHVKNKISGIKHETANYDHTTHVHVIFPTDLEPDHKQLKTGYFIVFCDCYNRKPSGITVFKNVDDADASKRLKSKYLFDPFSSMDSTQRAVILDLERKEEIVEQYFGGIELKKRFDREEVKGFPPGVIAPFHFVHGESMKLKGPGTPMPSYGTVRLLNENLIQRLYKTDSGYGYRTE